jgi:hypothetical protein
MLFESQIPQPLNLLEAFVVENEEYPIVVLGSRKVLMEQFSSIL